MAFSYINGVELLSGAAGAAFLYLSSREMHDASSELLELTIDPVFFGMDVPAGDGHPVMVLPGLFATDQYLRPLRGWLRRIGYNPLTSGLKRDMGKLKVHTAQVLDQLAAEARGTKASLIGHSYGGVIARAVAREHP
jgi:pimeloyl-ACP methyl ester carboxylesterase